MARPASTASRLTRCQSHQALSRARAAGDRVRQACRLVEASRRRGKPSSSSSRPVRSDHWRVRRSRSAASQRLRVRPRPSNRCRPHQGGRRAPEIGQVFRRLGAAAEIAARTAPQRRQHAAWRPCRSTSPSDAGSRPEPSRLRRWRPGAREPAQYRQVRSGCGSGAGGPPCFWQAPGHAASSPKSREPELPPAAAQSCSSRSSRAAKLPRRE